MDSSRLKEIRTKLNTLPILHERLTRLNQQIKQAEDTVTKLKSKFEDEMQDMEQLLKESFFVSLLHFVGKYEGKLTKETQEQLLAKIEYDKASDRVDQLNIEQDELSNRIKLLNIESEQFKEELNLRREEIVKNVTGILFARYNEIDAQLKECTRQLVENDEALRAAQRVISTAKSAIGSLESAEGWATYDVWSRGGLISHIAKYNRIDEAQSSLSRLDSQLNDLHRELSDVNMCDYVNYTSIDSTTKAIDFWFDNIFTDLNVRTTIRDNKEELISLCDRINSISTKLESNKTGVYNKITQLEKNKEDLLMEV